MPHCCWIPVAPLGIPAEPLAFLDLDPVPLALVAAPPLTARSDLTPTDLIDERLLVNV